MAYSPLPTLALAPTFEGKKTLMVEITQNTIIITLAAEAPAHKLAELQSGLIYVLNDYFSHLDNEVDVESVPPTTI